MRTCIVCRQERGKRELVRIVRTPDETVRIDPTGKLAGRGAYLCRARPCWEQALQGHRLGAALKTTLSAEIPGRVARVCRHLPDTLEPQGHEEHKG